jgi:hypothetical protein
MVRPNGNATQTNLPAPILMSCVFNDCGVYGSERVQSGERERKANDDVVAGWWRKKQEVSSFNTEKAWAQ